MAVTAATYVFGPHEAPILPGSPYSPAHPAGRRAGYFAIGVLLGLGGGLGGALVQVNLAHVQAALALDPTEAAWLLAAYFGFNINANLLLLKYRQQFGLARFVRWVLALYAGSSLAHLVIATWWSGMLVRAISGLAGTGLGTLTILYVMQAVPPDKRLFGAMIGITLPQLATPLARVLSPALLTEGDWRTTFWFEGALALATLAAITALPLPPNKREPAFERADFLTFALFAGGITLIIAVLVQGRIAWWTDAPWIGVALAVAIGLIASAMIIERGRARPLLDLRWLGTRQIGRLMAVALVVRLLLSEQAVGSIGLLSALGMGEDQLVTLNVVVLAGEIAGMAGMLLLFRPHDMQVPILLAVALIAMGALVDAGATNLTRPAELYASQALIGFAAILFLGATMAIGIARTLLAGPRAFISYVVLFGMSQSLGGLAGSAALGTFQTVREKVHSAALVEQVRPFDPIVALRLAGAGRGLSASLGDPAQRRAAAVSQLSLQARREANVLAYNDVFAVIGAGALATLAWGLTLRIGMWRRREPSPVVELMQRMKRRGGA